jgi:hypothetical protein
MTHCNESARWKETHYAKRIEFEQANLVVSCSHEELIAAVRQEGFARFVSVHANARRLTEAGESVRFEFAVLGRTALKACTAA